MRHIHACRQTIHTQISIKRFLWYLEVDIIVLPIYIYFVHGAALEPVLASCNEFYAIGKDHADNPDPEFRWGGDRLSCEPIHVGKGLRITMCFLHGRRGRRGMLS